MIQNPFNLNNILKNIHWLFLGLALFTLIYGVYVHINLADSALDINIHDTMFVISTAYILAFQSGVFFMFGLTYYSFYKIDKYKPIDSLSILHIVLTIIGLGVIFFMPEFQHKLPVESTADMYANSKGLRFNYNVKAFSALGVFVAQILFLVNLFVALFRK